MNSLNKTFLPYSNYKTRNWFVIDCKGQKLGRLVTFIIALLKGKTKPNYYSSIDRVCTTHTVSHNSTNKMLSVLSHRLNICLRNLTIMPGYHL